MTQHPDSCMCFDCIAARAAEVGRALRQGDRAAKKDQPSDGWNRHRMNETHRKGKRGSKKVTTRARRRVDTSEEKA